MNRHQDAPASSRQAPKDTVNRRFWRSTGLHSGACGAGAGAATGCRCRSAVWHGSRPSLPCSRTAMSIRSGHLQTALGAATHRYPAAPGCSACRRCRRPKQSGCDRTNECRGAGVPGGPPAARCRPPWTGLGNTDTASLGAGPAGVKRQGGAGAGGSAVGDACCQAAAALQRSARPHMPPTALPPPGHPHLVRQEVGE